MDQKHSSDARIDLISTERLYGRMMHKISKLDDFTSKDYVSIQTAQAPGAAN